VRAGFALDLSLDSDFGDVPDNVQQNLYRVAQEALANVAEHAQARSVQIRLTRDDGQVRLAISDDGRGFDPALPEETVRYGLRGMRERAEMSGGSLVVDSKAGEGTNITYMVTVPRATAPVKAGGSE